MAQPPRVHARLLVPSVVVFAFAIPTLAAAPTTAAPTTAAPTTAAPTTAAPTTAAPTTAAPTTAAPTTAGPVCTTAACHAALFAVTSLSPADVAAMTGVVWRPGCPVSLDRLRNVAVGYLGPDGAVHGGTLVVHEDIADDVLDAFGALLDAGFVIARIAPATVQGGDDIALMRANITSAFNCRAVTGGRAFSPHAYGIAVDVNPLWNPWMKDGRVLPAEGAPFVVGRARAPPPGMLVHGSAAVAVFEQRGFVWGGRWRSLKDWQHVEKRTTAGERSGRREAAPLNRRR
jgi:hypothetical protein